MTPDQIKETLRLHKLWIDDDPSGVRANLRGANLWRADLQGANLRGSNLRGANLQDANLWRADLQGANLQDANLQGANLWGSNLRGANLRGAVGNMREIKSLEFDTWPVTYTADTLQIGCQRHSIDLWRKSDPRWIAAMDPKASVWWDKFGAIILSIIDASPATVTPTQKETT